MKILILCLLFPFIAFAQSITELRQTFFKMLDYQQPEIALKLVSFEKKLAKNSDKILEKSSINLEEALYLVYTGMYVRNTSDAVSAGKLTIEDLITYSEEELSSENEIFAAREKYRIRLFEKALEVLKDDHLVQGFKLGAEIWLEKFTKDQVSQKLIDSMFKMAKKEAIPNIFSTLIIANEIQLSEKDIRKLSKLRRQSLNKFRFGLLKRSPRPHDKTPFAFDTKNYAPYATMAAKVILADATLMDSIKRSGFSRGYNANTTLAVYQSLFKEKTPVIAELTNQWPNKKILLKRIQMTNDFIKNGVIPQVTMEENRLLYNCASCHSK